MQGIGDRNILLDAKTELVAGSVITFVISLLRVILLIISIILLFLVKDYAVGGITIVLFVIATVSVVSSWHLIGIVKNCVTPV